MKTFALEILACLIVGVLGLQAATKAPVFSYPSAAGNPKLRIQYIWTGNDQWTVYYRNNAGTLKIIKGLDGGTAWSYVTGSLKPPQ